MSPLPAKACGAYPNDPIATSAGTTDSSIAPAIIESCPQRIFLANDRAIEPQGRATYERFGLNERQIELVARATPKRHYYLQSRRGNRLFELALGPVALAFCGSSDAASQSLIDDLIERHGPDGFTAAMLRARGLDWAADLLADFPDGQPAATDPLNPQQKELFS